MDKKIINLPPLRQNKANSQTNSSTAINAVAFQDHWVRLLSLGTKPIGPQKIGLGPAAKEAKKKTAKAMVDTGLKKSKPKPVLPQEKEYVLDEKPPPLTLAQKLGLVEAPQQPLSESEWSKLKAKSNARDDSKEPCVICKEDYGLQEQVILSCSHVFHRACLHAFERYTGRKTCPMCRREQYQTRVIHEGARNHRHACATKIQAAWRGYIVRCWYKKLRQTVPPNDPKLRRKFYLEKFEDITDRIIRSCDFDIGNFLSEIDNSLEQSRTIFKQFDTVHRIISDEEWEQIQLKAVERSHQDCPICLTGLGATSPDPSPPTKADQPQKHSKPVLVLKSNATPSFQSRSLPKSKTPAGRAVKAGAQGDRGDGIGKSENPEVKEIESSEQDKGEGWCIEASAGKSHSRKEVRRTVLLSCSHVFHETCLRTLEELTLGEIRSTCPVCRTPYKKRVITL